MRLSLSKLPLAPRGVPEIEVYFAVGRDHHLIVRALGISAHPSSMLKVVLGENHQSIDENLEYGYNNEANTVD